MNVKTISAAKAQLSALVQRVIDGEEVVIGRAGKPVVILTRYSQDKKKRTPGALRGKIRIADDFDELPFDIAQAFGAVAEGQGAYDTKEQEKKT